MEAIHICEFFFELFLILCGGFSIAKAIRIV